MELPDENVFTAQNIVKAFTFSETKTVLKQLAQANRALAELKGYADVIAFFIKINDNFIN